MRATTIFHPVLVIGTAPTEAVLAVAHAARARAPYRPLVIVVNQARAGAVAAALPDATVLGFEGSRFALDVITVRTLVARLAATTIHEIHIAATGHTIREYAHVVRAARRLGRFPRRVLFAQARPDGQVVITPARWRRVRELIGSPLARGPLGWTLLGLAGATVGLGLDLPLAPWLCLAAAHVLTAISQAVSWQEYTGDAGIHLQLARRTGSGEPFCYDHGRYSAGSSSPLWTLILSVLWRLGARRLESAATLTAAIAAHGALIATAVAAHAWLGGGPAWGLAPLFLATLPQFHVWTCRAMETSTAALLGALTAAITLTAAPPPAWAATLVLALAFLVRWEHAALLTPIFAVAVWRSGPAVLLAVVPALAVAALNFVRTGSPVASTASSRRRAAQASRHDTGASRVPEAVRDLVTSKPALALLAGLGLFAVASHPSPGVLAVTAGFLLSAAFFTVAVPMTYDERYLMPFIPVYVLLAASAPRALPAGAPREAALIALGIIAAERITVLAGGWPARRRAAIRGHRHEREFRRRVAQDLDRLLPAHGTVACIEVDLRWFMRRDDTRILGLDAVLDGTVAPHVDSGRYGDLLRRRHVSHVLIEENLHRRAGWGDTDLEPLVGAQGAVDVPGAGRLVPARAWTYRNWGNGTPVRWMLWRVEGDTVVQPPAAPATVDTGNDDIFYAEAA